MATRTVWTGKASDLLGALGEVVGERGVKSKTWPDSPRALSGRLRRAATFLRKIGIEIAFEREGQARTRTISITTRSAPENEGARPSESSASVRERRLNEDLLSEASRKGNDKVDHSEPDEMSCANNNRLSVKGADVTECSGADSRRAADDWLLTDYARASRGF
jgi:hypothetical protein